MVGRYAQIDGAWWDAPDRPQVKLTIGADGGLIAPPGFNPYADAPPGAAALDCPNVDSSQEATCRIAAIPYQRSWKLFGVKQQHAVAELYADSAGGGTYATQAFAIIKEGDVGDDAPLLEALPGDGNVWTIEVSKLFAGRIKSEAERLRPVNPYSSN